MIDLLVGPRNAVYDDLPETIDEDDDSLFARFKLVLRDEPDGHR